MLKDWIPAAWRKKVYAAYAFIGLAFGATSAGFAAADTGLPEWLVVALAVFAFVGGPLGATAGGNVNDPADVDPDEQEGF